MDIKKTDTYETWFISLRDEMAKARINTRKGQRILLAGGDKSTQSKDIQTALQLSKELKL